MAKVAIAGTAIGAITGLGTAFAGGLKAAVSYETLQNKTNAVIKSTGNVANISVKGIQNLAGKLEHLSGVDEELIINSQNVLATFTKVRNETGKGNQIFDKATASALNLSVALGTDLQSATTMVGKALNDPLAGLTSLTRAGIQFTDEQKNLIRTLVESGDVLGAQRVILGELETQFGGTAEAAGKGLAGDMARLKDAFGDAFRELGTAVLPGLTTAATFLAQHLPGVLAVVKTLVRDGLNVLSGWWDRNGETVKSGLGSIGSVLKDDVAPFLATIGTILKDSVLPALVDFGEWIVNNEVRFDIFKTMIAGLAIAWVGYTVAAGAAAAATLLPLLPFVALAGVGAALAVVLDRLIDRFSVGLSQAIQKVVNVGSGILGFFRDLVGILKRAVELAIALSNILPGIKLPGGGGGKLPFLGPLDPTAGIPFVPFFDEGGTVPGRRGAPQLIMAHGGETVLPTHKPGFGMFDAVGEDQLLELRRNNDLLREQNGILRGMGAGSIAQSRAAVML